MCMLIVKMYSSTFLKRLSVIIIYYSYVLEGLCKIERTFGTRQTVHMVRVDIIVCKI